MSAARSSLAGRLRVCHLIHGLEPGGAERVLVELARCAPDVGLTLSVVSLMAIRDRGISDDLAGAGASVRSIDLRTRWDPRAFARCTALLRELRPALLHTHLKHADIVGSAAARRLGLPVVSTLHVIESDVRGVAAAKRWAGARARTAGASRTIAVSDAQRRWYVDRWAGAAADVVTIRNGVADAAPLPPGERDRVRGELGVATGDLLLVCVGLLRPEKGHDDLLTAVTELPGELRPVVALAGDGPCREAVGQRVAADPRLRGRVRLLGFRTDVERLLAAADIVVQPSHEDALPTTLLQALAAGRAVVATAVGGIPEIVTAECGIVVPPHQPATLAAALTRLGADPALRTALGTTGRARYLQQFTAHGWAQRLRATYDDVLAGTGR